MKVGPVTPNTFVLKPWNPAAEIREYVSEKDDIAATHIVIARGTENGVMMEHHYLTDLEHLNDVQRAAKLYENWSVIIKTIGEYITDRWGILVVE